MIHPLALVTLCSAALLAGCGIFFNLTPELKGKIAQNGYEDTRKMVAQSTGDTNWTCECWDGRYLNPDPKVFTKAELTNKTYSARCVGTIGVGKLVYLVDTKPLAPNGPSRIVGVFRVIEEGGVSSMRWFAPVKGSTDTIAKLAEDQERLVWASAGAVKDLLIVR